MYKEYSLSINDFLEPKTFDDGQGICALLVRLLLLEPGTFQSHPEMGVGIISKYRYMFSDEVIPALRKDLESQVEKYLPQLDGINFDLRVIDKCLYITATIDKTAYMVKVSNNGEVNTAYKTLAQIANQ